MYMSSGVCFWIHFEFPEGFERLGPGGGLATYTHTLYRLD